LETRQYEDAATYILTQQNYDEMGRLHQRSNPYRPASETPLWTTTQYDALDRIIQVTMPDANIVTTSYGGNQTTVTDEAGRSRRSTSDALGRLTSVLEDPNGLNYATTYDYDALGNLLHVLQGVQTRTFLYDGLSRLTSATNPESGALSYSYDENGNLLSKTDA